MLRSWDTQCLRLRFPQRALETMRIPTILFILRWASQYREGTRKFWSSSFWSRSKCYPTDERPWARYLPSRWTNAWVLVTYNFVREWLYLVIKPRLRVLLSLYINLLFHKIRNLNVFSDFSSSSCSSVFPSVIKDCSYYWNWTKFKAIKNSKPIFVRFQFFS